jgi:hypothetical protein
MFMQLRRRVAVGLRLLGHHVLLWMLMVLLNRVLGLLMLMLVKMRMAHAHCCDSIVRVYI